MSSPNQGAVPEDTPIGKAMIKDMAILRRRAKMNQRLAFFLAHNLMGSCENNGPKTDEKPKLPEDFVAQLREPLDDALSVENATESILRQMIDQFNLTGEKPPYDEKEEM
jgi:hypothetical protein